MVEGYFSYYAQVQGLMAIGKRLWCDFVVFFNASHLNEFWTDKLLPTLSHFYDNCVAPELISPVLGLPI